MLSVLPETYKIVTAVIELLLQNFELHLIQATFTKKLPVHATRYGMAATLSNVYA